MTLRFLGRHPSAVVLLIGAAALAASSAWAQGHEGRSWIQPPRELPRVEGNQQYSLDTLFAALKIAPDESSAKAIENRIWARWLLSRSDTCNLLMSRVGAAMEAKDYDLAIKLLNAVIDINPDYVEGWNRRATLYYLKNDYAHSIADLRQVLAREPRHFGALSGLGLMLQELGDEKDALTAYRKALAINPHLEHVGEVVKTLADKVDGRDI